MSLIVEDGTGLAGAEAYISVADATAYLAARGKGDAWDAIDDKEAALRNGADYMMQAYRSRWLGVRRHIAQALDWPRSYVPVFDSPSGYRSYPSYFSDAAVPVEVQRANAELALKSASETLAPDLGPQAVEKTVGPITIRYKESTPELKRFTSIDLMLKTYLVPNTGSVKLVRA